ncbi:unnamed protein product [Linum trigynum]|uniref:Uncharacterized protein n=1 Tax=Linum trigynum TaxID=586398 RepID=A0AAV2FS88_9ROSI
MLVKDLFNCDAALPLEPSEADDGDPGSAQSGVDFQLLVRLSLVRLLLLLNDGVTLLLNTISVPTTAGKHGKAMGDVNRSSQNRYPVRYIMTAIKRLKIVRNRTEKLGLSIWLSRGLGRSL